MMTVDQKDLNDLLNGNANQAKKQESKPDELEQKNNIKTISSDIIKTNGKSRSSLCCVRQENI